MLFFTAAILLYAERDAQCKTKANATLLLLVLSNNVTISRLNRISRQLHPVELAVNWQTTSAWYYEFSQYYLFIYSPLDFFVLFVVT